MKVNSCGQDLSVVKVLLTKILIILSMQKIESELVFSSSMT